MLNTIQVFVITLAFFAAVAALGLWLARPGDEGVAGSAKEVIPSDQVSARLQQFERGLQERLNEVDAHVAEAHARIDRQVGSVR